MTTTASNPFGITQVPRAPLKQMPSYEDNLIDLRQQRATPTWFCETVKTMMTRTPWFKDGQIPFYIGEYEIYALHGNLRAYWDGEYWTQVYPANNIAEKTYAIEDVLRIQPEQFSPWRGLANKPE